MMEAIGHPGFSFFFFCSSLLMRLGRWLRSSSALDQYGEYSGLPLLEQLFWLGPWREFARPSG